MDAIGYERIFVDPFTLPQGVIYSHFGSRNWGLFCLILQEFCKLYGTWMFYNSPKNVVFAEIFVFNLVLVFWE